MKNVKLFHYELRKIKHLICSFIKYCLLFIALTFSVFLGNAQNILPTPRVFNLKEGSFIFPKKVGVYSKNKDSYFLNYLKERVLRPTKNSMSFVNRKNADVVFLFDKAMAKKAYTMDVTPLRIQIKARRCRFFLRNTIALSIEDDL